MIDNRTFWNTLTPFFIRFTEKNFFNEFFANAVPNLNIPEFNGNFDQSDIVVSECPIINAIYCKI